MAEKINESELVYANFMDVALKQGMTLTDLKLQLNVGDRFSPISLTEDWLFKFGFNKEIDNEFNPMVLVLNKRIHLYADNQNDYSDIYAFVFLGKNKDEIRICDNFKYVHQLQNLYFALTGIELQIK